MPLTTATNSLRAQGESPNLFPSPPRAGDEQYNTIYQRIMDRVESENNPVPLVLACVAYSMYKNEKRQWITDFTNKNGIRPSNDQIDYYVSSWSDLRIESTFSAARTEIETFVENIMELAKDDLSGEVYQALFRSTSDQIKQHSLDSQTRANNIASLIKARTKSNWFLNACTDVVVSVIANFIWFALTIVILIGLYAQFDFSRFLDKTKTLFTNQEAPASVDKTKPQN